MAQHIPKLAINITKEACAKYMSSLVEFATTHCGMERKRSVNRVDLKKSILNATRGVSLAKFVHFLDINEKWHLKNLCLMECPVTCPNKKSILPPVESMPRNIITSCKKLRNFFGIPEVQICRGCSKRSQCRRYQEIDRNVPDLSDLASVLIGVHTICKLLVDDYQGIVASYALKELGSVMSILEQLNKYFKINPRTTEIPRGDDEACNRVLRHIEREKQQKKLQLLQEKIFNIPNTFKIKPGEFAYLTAAQRELYKVINKSGKKKNKEEEYIWVADATDDTLGEHFENKSLCKINKAQFGHDHSMTITSLHTCVSSKANDDICRIENLPMHSVKFRMEYDTPIGEETNLTRMDIFNGKYIEGITLTQDGRTRIDLDRHLDKSDDTDSANNTHDIQGLEMYRPVSEQKAAYFSKYIQDVPNHAKALAFLKRVPYSYKCQSSGEMNKPRSTTLQDDIKQVTEISQAIESASQI